MGDSSTGLGVPNGCWTEAPPDLQRSTPSLTWAGSPPVFQVPTNHFFFFRELHANSRATGDFSTGLEGWGLMAAGRKPRPLFSDQSLTWGSKAFEQSIFTPRRRPLPTTPSQRRRSGAPQSLGHQDRQNKHPQTQSMETHDLGHLANDASDWN